MGVIGHHPNGDSTAEYRSHDLVNAEIRRSGGDPAEWTYELTPIPTEPDMPGGWYRPNETPQSIRERTRRRLDDGTGGQNGQV